ncbi:MAG: GumC family protein [Rhizobiaceae bacterium]|nr:GumC family protein [Rhizobiaceae bacterium]
MLKVEARDMRADPATDALDRYLRIDLPLVFSWLRRGAKWIFLAALIGAVAGVGYTVMVKPRYAVTTEILLDPAGLQVVPDDLFRQEGQQRDAALLSLESKRQTLVSRSVLMKVVDSLNLQRDPEFVPPLSATSQFSLRSLIGGDEATAQSPEIVALDNLMRRVSARRDELSFVIILTTWTDNPQKSILISDEIVKIFREELIAADADGARRSADALIQRIAELKDDVTASERAVESFRREHGLQSSQGELVRTRSMSQVNQQLVAAREKVIEAQSRYDDLMSSDSTDAAAMQSPTVSSLRTQYATLKSKADADALIYGPRHPRIEQQQIELRGLQNEIEAEKRRIVQSAKNNLDQAKAVVAALEQDASEASADVFTDNDSQVRLRELTREAAAKTAIYEAFLVRARQITERQQIDTTNMRVISPPIPPRTRSWPPSTLQMAGLGAISGSVLGALAVIALGIAHEMGSGRSRVPSRPTAPEIDETPLVQANSETVPKPVAVSARPSNSLLSLQTPPPGGPEGPDAPQRKRKYSTGF